MSRHRGQVPSLLQPCLVLSTQRDREGAPQTWHQHPTPQWAVQKQPHSQNQPVSQGQERAAAQRQEGGAQAPANFLPGLALWPLEGLVPVGHNTEKGDGGPVLGLIPAIAVLKF